MYTKKKLFSILNKNIKITKYIVVLPIKLDQYNSENKMLEHSFCTFFIWRK